MRTMREYREVIEITKTITQHWAAVTGAYDCRCGHTHHGRQLYEDGRLSHLSPQFSICDEATCPCSALMRVAV
jgi:hypothetical protein